MKKTTYEDEHNSLEAMAGFLSRDDVITKKIFIAPGTREVRTKFFIFYEEVAQQLLNEKIEIEYLEVIANKVEKDPAYAKLKNQKQRVIYLLEKYAQPKEHADTIIEIIKIHEIIIAEGLDNTLPERK